MIDGKTISLVMPCRNEAVHLQTLIEQLPDFFDEVILVSNKSTDNTVEVGKELAKQHKKLHVIQDDRTADGIGYGYAHMTGMSRATGEIIVCADADGTYPVEQAPSLIEQMNQRNLVFVSCSRYPDPDIPAKLQLGVRILNLEIALLYWFGIKDSLSGMWIFHRSCVQALHLTEGDWNLSPQIKINAHRYFGKQYAELSIKQRVRFGETKQDYFKTGMSHLLWILKNRFVRASHVQKSDK